MANPITQAITDAKSITGEVLEQYNKKTPRRLKVIDTYLVFCTLIVLLQVAYRFIKGPHPLHCLLAAGFYGLGQFALAAAMRIQLTSDEFKRVSNKTAFTEFFIGSVVLGLFMINYVG